MKKKNENIFLVKKDYGLIFCKERRTLKWFKDTPGIPTHWPSIKNPDNQINVPYIHDLDSMKFFMFYLNLMFSKENLRTKEIDLGEHCIALIYY